MVQREQFQPKSMKGIYVLVVSVERNINVKVGKLGSLRFEKGLYAYVGSAQNNLQKRVRRHLGREKKKFWHIDFLLDNLHVKVLQVFYRNVERFEECRIAKELGKEGVAVPDFGSSDCRCKSHLFKVQGTEFLRGYMNEMNAETKIRSY
jgi:Uri superfamily endonuclease